MEIAAVLWVKEHLLILFCSILDWFISFKQPHATFVDTAFQILKYNKSFSYSLPFRFII